MRSTPERAVLVRTLACVMFLCCVLAADLLALVKLVSAFREACTLEPTAQEMRQHGARKEEVSLNFTLLETHSIDNLHGKLFFGLLACRTCSHINYQECRKSTSQDWYLIRKYHRKVFILL